MRKAIVLTVLAVLCAWSVGCIVVVGGQHMPDHTKVVEIDGELYVVNTRTNKACRVSGEEESASHTTIETNVETETAGD